MRAEGSNLYSKVKARKGMKGRCNNCSTDLVTDRGDELVIMPAQGKRTCLKGKCPHCGHWTEFR